MRVTAAAMVVAAVLATGMPTATAREQHTIEFRPVLAEFQGPPSANGAEVACRGCAVLPVADPTAEPDRLLVGPTRIDGRGLKGARSQFSNGQYVLLMTLKPAALKEFNEMAAELYPKSPPQNAVAIVVDGYVVSSPAFRESHFDRRIQVSGNFSARKARALAATIVLACGC